MKKIFLIMFSIACIAMFSATAHAWPDGQRDGLLMGITGGLGNTEFDTGSSTYDGTSLMAGLYLGAGLSEQVMLSFRYRYFNTDVDWTTFHAFIWGADLLFFPSPQSGFFITAGLGRMMVTVDAANTEDKWGMAFHAGVGYELTKWVFLMADYTHASLEDDLSGRTISIAIAVIGY